MDLAHGVSDNVTLYRHRALAEPRFLVAREDWTLEAACRGTDPNVFFPERGEDTKQRNALSVCARCSVTAECLDYAVTHNERGIWGATTGRQRQQLRRNRRVA